MKNNKAKWKAARRLFQRDERCSDPLLKCIYVEGKCNGCEKLQAEIKKGEDK